MSLDHISELPEVRDWETTAGAYAEVESPAACVNELAADALAAADREVGRLKTALVAIQSTTPGSAHRIAIQALAEMETP